MRLIDADVLIQEINEQCPDYKSNSVGCIVKSALNDCLKIIRRQPTIEAVPVVHGKWIHIESSDTMTGRAYECSNCKKMRYGSFMPPYCQMCGAKMDEKVVQNETRRTDAD